MGKEKIINAILTGDELESLLEEVKALNTSEENKKGAIKFCFIQNLGRETYRLVEKDYWKKHGTPEQKAEFIKRNSKKQEAKK